MVTQKKIGSGCLGSGNLLWLEPKHDFFFILKRSKNAPAGYFRTCFPGTSLDLPKDPEQIEMNPLWVPKLVGKEE